MTTENWISLAFVIISNAAIAASGLPDGMIPTWAKALALVVAASTTSALAFLRSLKPAARL
jgi:hypothetical protein